MQFSMNVRCLGCNRQVGRVLADTANRPDELQAKINKLVLAHRPDCPYYKEK
jgi:hypothetical protein